MRRLLTLVLLLPLAACTTSPPDTLPGGKYGNGQVQMIVTAAGASVQFGCGSGTISGTIPLDSHGGFDVAGVYIFGPIVVNPPDTPARYSGTLRQGILALTVTVEADPGPFTLGPYALVRDGGGSPIICAD